MSCSKRSPAPASRPRPGSTRTSRCCAIGLLTRYTDVINLPSDWQWLENPWVLGILGVLLTVEFVADKIPAVDHVNDVLQTVVRPTSGGLVFGAAGSAQTATVTDPSEFFASNQWVPIVVGIAISLAVHGMKATARAGINAMTLGFGAPVASTVEDIFSVGMSLAAILLPLLVLVFLGRARAGLLVGPAQAAPAQGRQALFVAGRNLLHGTHPESNDTDRAHLVQRSVALGTRLRF